jgi:hypothetical protein
VAAVAKQLAIVKKAFTTTGTAINGGDNVPRGMPFKFMIYINNPYGSVSGISLQDVLDASFVYQSGSMKVAGLAACADDVCDAGEETAIFAAVDSGTAVTDAVDAGDVAGITGNRIDVGDAVVGNGQLDINANSVWALVFEVVMN